MSDTGSCASVTICFPFLIPAFSFQTDETLRAEARSVLDNPVREKETGPAERALTRARYAGPCRQASALGFLLPYLDRPRLRSFTPAVSSVPRIMWYRTPGRSLTRPPLISTTECS